MLVNISSDISPMDPMAFKSKFRALRWMYPPFEVNEMHEKKTPLKVIFWYRKPVDVPVSRQLPIFYLYIYNTLFFWWIRGLHVLGEWMLVWISSLRITAAIHHQVDPSSIVQSIVTPSLYNQKTLETKVPAYTSPQQSTRFSFPSHFLLIFLNKVFERSTLKLSPNSSAKSLWHVETGTRRPWRSIKQRKGPVSQAPMRLRVATKKWERPKGERTIMEYLHLLIAWDAWNK